MEMNIITDQLCSIYNCCWMEPIFGPYFLELCPCCQRLSVNIKNYETYLIYSAFFDGFVDDTHLYQKVLQYTGCVLIKVSFHQKYNHYQPHIATSVRRFKHIAAEGWMRWWMWIFSVCWWRLICYLCVYKIRSTGAYNSVGSDGTLDNATPVIGTWWPA